MQGLGEGIEDGTDDAVKQAKDSMEEILDAADGGGFNFDFSGSTRDIPSGGSGTGIGAITMNIYGAQGQDVNELAEIISNKLAVQVNRNKAVFA